MAKAQAKHSEQYILNEVFNETDGLLYVQNLPQNSSIDVCYTGSNVTSIVKYIGSSSYTKTITYDGSGNVVSVSAWT